MYICAGRSRYYEHDSIVYTSGSGCPLCDALSQISDLESDKERMASDITDLENKISDLETTLEVQTNTSSYNIGERDKVINELELKEDALIGQIRDYELVIETINRANSNLENELAYERGKGEI